MIIISPAKLEMDYSKQHTRSEQNQTSHNNSHEDQQSGNNLFKQNGILRNVRFAICVDLIGHGIPHN